MAAAKITGRRTYGLQHAWLSSGRIDLLSIFLSRYLSFHSHSLYFWYDDSEIDFQGREILMILLRGHHYADALNKFDLLFSLPARTRLATRIRRASVYRYRHFTYFLCLRRLSCPSPAPLMTYQHRLLAHTFQPPAIIIIMEFDRFYEFTISRYFSSIAGLHIYFISPRMCQCSITYISHFIISLSLFYTYYIALSAPKSGFKDDATSFEMHKSSLPL